MSNVSRRAFVKSAAAAAASGLAASGHAGARSAQAEETPGQSPDTKPPETAALAPPDDYRAIVDRLRGPLVPILPAFTDDEALDLAATQRWVAWLVDSGVPMLWLTYGTSRYFALTDQEVFDLTKAMAEVTRGRALLIAGTNMHWPVHQCRRYIEHAARCGVDIVKVQCNWYLSPDDDAVFRYYRAVATDSPLPLFAYTLKVPGRTSGISKALLGRILEMPQFVGMKNDSGDFYEHRDYLDTIREHDARFTPMTGGSMMSFLWGYDFGARAFAAAYGMIDPKTPLEFHDHLLAGRRDEALAIVRQREEHMLTALAGLGGWQALRAGLVFKGFFRSWRDRFPMPTLTDAQAETVKDYLASIHLI